MEIRDIKITLNNGKGNPRLKGYVSIVISDGDLGFVIDNAKIIEGNGKLFVSMPSRKTKNGSYKDIIYPINKRTRELIERVILGKYMQQTC